MARLMLCHSAMTLARTIGARCAVLCAAVVAMLLFAPSALAQTPAVTGIVGTVLRLEPNGSSADNFTTGNPHPGGVPANVINYADCEANLSYQLTLSLSGTPSNYNLVAWAGPDDCTAAAARTSPGATCWPVTAGAISQSGGTDEAGAPTTTVTLNMRDIASQAGISGAVTPAYTPATVAACTAQTTDVASNISLYFFFVDNVGVGNAVGIAQAYPIIVDTLAQNVGSDGFTVAEQADTQLTVTVTATADPSTVVFNIYCDPPPGQESTVTQVPYDAATNNAQCIADSGNGVVDSASSTSSDGASGVDGATDASDDAPASFDSSIADTGVADTGTPISVGLDDAGGNPCGAYLNDSGIPSGTGCSSSILKSGGGSTGTKLVPETDDAGNDVYVDGGIVYVEAGTTVGGTMTLGIPSQYLCGTVSASNPTFTLTGLRDGYYYTIAVGAVDSAGNVGPLGVQCQQSVQLADFWYDYTSAGGQAGGGYCATTERGVGTPAGMTGLGILAVASVVAAIRRRRR